MSSDQLKREVASLSSQGQAELISYALHLRYAGDVDYRREVTERLNDSDRSHWLTPEEFERQLDNA
jgi:asparagine synthetase B (glutamine-hydrolysing)